MSETETETETETEAVQKPNRKLRRTRTMVPYQVYASDNLTPRLLSYSNTRLSKCVDWISKNAQEGMIYEIIQSFGTYCIELTTTSKLKKVVSV